MNPNDTITSELSKAITATNSIWKVEIRQHREKCCWEWKTRELQNLHFGIITIESTVDTTAKWKVKFENDNNTEHCSCKKGIHVNVTKLWKITTEKLFTCFPCDFVDFSCSTFPLPPTTYKVFWQANGNDVVKIYFYFHLGFFPYLPLSLFHFTIPFIFVFCNNIFRMALWTRFRIQKTKKECSE